MAHATQYEVGVVHFSLSLDLLQVIVGGGGGLAMGGGGGGGAAAAGGAGGSAPAEEEKKEEKVEEKEESDENGKGPLCLHMKPAVQDSTQTRPTRTMQPLVNSSIQVVCLVTGKLDDTDHYMHTYIHTYIG